MEGTTEDSVGVMDNQESVAQQESATGDEQVSEVSQQEREEDLDPSERGLVIDAQELNAHQELVDYAIKLNSQNRDKLGDFNFLSALESDPKWVNIVNKAESINPQELQNQMQAAGIGAGDRYPQIQQYVNAAMQRMNKTVEIRRQIASQKLDGHDTARRGRRAEFNLHQVKTAQGQTTRLPVSSVGEFIDNFLSDLLSWNGEAREEDARSGQSVTEIQSNVGQGFEHEANSALKTIQQMPIEQEDEAACILAKIYSNWLAPAAKSEQPEMAENTMAEKIQGIIKFNLSEHVLNNKEVKMIKTAGFGGNRQEYSLYGPTEKRVCPKLRGRGGGPPGSGDVVSEYICRHHCLDGLVIDDNKTVCGEALWRANVADKFSREYVNADGNIVGGYLNKRFEINRNVPEENKMRLKPGEIRKPRPAELFGNMEARMQAMRNKEADKRNYRPNTDTSKPFNWTKDVDQNNVEVSQKERDRREEYSGHEIVNYKKKDQQENNPKIASTNKEAIDQLAVEIKKDHQGERDQFAKEIQECHHDDKLKEKKGKPKKSQAVEEVEAAALINYSGFNLKNHKTAQGGAIAPVVEDGRSIDLDLEDPKIRTLKKKDKREMAQPFRR